MNDALKWGLLLESGRKNREISDYCICSFMKRHCLNSLENKGNGTCKWQAS